MRLKRSKLIALLAVLALAIGFLVRIAPAIHHQTYFWFDQGLDTISVKQLVVDHKINLVSRYSGLVGVLMGPLWTWLLAIPFALSGGSPVGSTVFFSALSVLSAIAIYKFLSSISKSAAFFTFLLFLFSPILISYSQIAASPHPLSFLFIFYLWFLYKIVVVDKPKFWLPLLLLAGLFFQLEIGFALFALLAIFVVILVFRRWQSLINNYFLLGLVAFAVTFLPQILFDLRHDFLISKGALAIFGGKSSLYGVHDSLPIRFVERAKSFRDDFTLMTLYIQPLALAIFALAASIYGWVLIFKNKPTKLQNLFKILAAVTLTFYIGFSFYPGPLWTWYRAGLPIVYIILFAMGIAVLWEKIPKLRFVIVPLLILFVVQGANPQKIMENISDKPIDDNAILENQEKAIDYVYRNAAGRQFSYFAYTPPVYDYIWQYNFYWYGKNKYGYLPKNWQMTIPLLGIGEQNEPPKTDEGLFFLIIEPNRERPWEIDGWKKSYIKYGQVLQSYEFPGKIIVEERVAH